MIKQSNATIKASDNGNALLVSNLGNTFKSISDSVNFTMTDCTNDFSMPKNGVINYLGDSQIECIISAQYSLLTINGGVSMGICLYKNGVQIEKSIIIDPSHPIIIDCSVSLNKNDYIEMYINSTSEDQEVEIIQCQLSITGYSSILI